MTKEEWMANFQAIYGRSPNHTELAEALEDGEFMQTEGRYQRTLGDQDHLNTFSLAPGQSGDTREQQVYRTFLRRYQIRRTLASFRWLFVGLGLFIAVFAIFTSAAFILNRHNLTGTWRQVSVDGSLKDPNFYGAGAQSSYLIVDQEHHLTAINLVQPGKVDQFQSQITLSDYLPSGLSLETKQQLIVPDMTLSQYQNRLRTIFRRDIPGYLNQQGQAKTIAKHYLTTYKNYLGPRPAYTLTYELKGNTLTIFTKNAAGKIVLICKFQRMTHSQAEKIEDTYQHERTKFKDRYSQTQ